MVYLNDVEHGAGIKLFATDQVFIPQYGRAVPWTNPIRDGSIDPASPQAGLPVEAGETFITAK